MRADDHPVFRIPVPTPGNLFVMPAPVGRDLEAWSGQLKSLGVTDVVSLLEFEEAHAIGVGDEPAVCAANGLAFQNVQIQDFGTPSGVARDAFARVVGDVARGLTDGRSFAVHCRAGIGRAGLVTCCVLKTLGCTAEEAMARASKARGHRVPEAEGQRVFVRNFEPADMPLT